MVVVPSGNEQAALLQDKGFQWAFPLRCLPREVERNLWSQAEFDTVTAKKLCELRARFWPDTVQLPPEQMAVVLGICTPAGPPSSRTTTVTEYTSARRTPFILWR